MRPSGHHPAEDSTNGSVTSIGLHISPRARNATTGRYRQMDGLRTFEIGAYRQQPEQGAQYILPFRDPRHRLHMQRMHREKGRNERALPEPSRSSATEPETAAPCSPGGTSHSPGDATPASRPNNFTSVIWDSQVTGCQFAAWKVVKAQETPSFDRPLLDLRVFVDILTVVIVDEQIASHLPENKKDQEG